MSFTLDLSKFAKKAVGRIDDVNRAAVMLAAQGLILKTPVDTGRARANWVFGYGAPNTQTGEQVDKGGATTIGNIQAEVQSVKSGSVCYVTNSLPYIDRLEHGWSKQAPAGMIRTTFAELPDAVMSYIRGLA